MNFLSNLTTYEDNVDKTHELLNFTSNNLNNNENSKSILLNFPMVPLDKPIYGCYELNAKFHYGNTPDFDRNLLNKHNLPIFEQINDLLSETASHMPQINTIDKQPIFKRLFNTYLDSGLIGLCEEIVYSKTSQQLPMQFKKSAEYLIKIIDLISSPINPWILSNKENEFSFRTIKGGNWKMSLIKAFQWHPHSTKYAVALKNDLVKVYSTNQVPVILKHLKQINVTCLAWKPFYSSIIAIGCANCIIIWDTDTLPVSIKPSSSCSFVLSQRYHKDIIDLQWYPKSDFLLSVATKDNDIMIWDITLKTCVPIKRIGSNGFSLARFTPNGHKLFTADLSTSFRIWNPINYTSEKWTNLVSRCNAACWSPDGSILLFSCEDCSLLYCLKFLNNDKQELQIVCDLSNVYLFDKFNDSSIIDQSTINRYSVGGSINDMCWDPTAQRLAISFKRTNMDTHVNIVAVFLTKFQPNFQVLPCGFVNDLENASPTIISFKAQFDPGALLTISWSSGRIQHVPFYFNKIVDDYGHTVSNLTFF